MTAGQQDSAEDRETRAKGEVFASNCEMGALMCAHDWTSSPLGPVAEWPQSLRTSVSICLNSRFPIVLFWGPDFLMLYNDEYRPIIGSKYTTAFGHPARTHWPEVWHIVFPMLQSVVDTGQATWSEDLLLPIERSGDIQDCYFTFSYSPILDEKGKIAGVFCPVTDTTERVLAEKALRESEARLRLTTDSAGIGIWSYFLQENRLLWSPQMKRLFGLFPDDADLTYEQFLDYVCSEDQQRVDMVIKEVIEKCQDLDLEYRIVWPDGSVHWIGAKGRAFPADSGGPARLLGVAFDMTSRKHTEEALQQSERELRALANAAPSMVWAAAPDGSITFSGERWRSYSGLTAEQTTHGWLPLVLHPDDQDRCLAQWNQALQQGTEYEIEVRNRRHDGEYRWFLTRAVPVRDAVGRVTAWFGTTTDIHDRKQAEEKLQQLTKELQRSNTDLEQFAYVASHDLQAPLRKLSSFVELFARRYQGQFDSQADELIKYIVDGAHRTQELVQDLLTYARVGVSDLPSVPTNCEIELKRVLNTLQSQIRETGAIITYDPLPTVWGAARQVEEVFQNLLSNALKFHGAEAPRIHISAQHENNQWVFAVRDNGIGIDPQHTSRLFGLFQRLHSQREYPGTGIGLAICKKIIERYGGRIWVESTAGQGATFFFSIADHC